MCAALARLPGRRAPDARARATVARSCSCPRRAAGSAIPRATPPTAPPRRDRRPDEDARVRVGTAPGSPSTPSRPTVFRSPLTAWMYAEEPEGVAVREGMLARIPLGRLGEPDDFVGPCCSCSRQRLGFVTGPDRLRRRRLHGRLSRLALRRRALALAVVGARPDGSRHRAGVRGRAAVPVAVHDPVPAVLASGAATRVAENLRALGARPRGRRSAIALARALARSRAGERRLGVRGGARGSRAQAGAVRRARPDARRRGAVLATNTSVMPIGEIASRARAGAADPRHALVEPAVS